MRYISVFCIVFFALPLSLCPAVAQDMDEVEITTHPVADNVFMLTGRGGNIGLVVTENGAFLIDDQYAPLTAKIKAAVAEVTDQPVKFVLNTHWHGDHTGGNENLADGGSLIVAHDNVRKRLSTTQFLSIFDREVEPSPEGALPVVTFNDSMTFHLGGLTIHATHVPNAHTDGDAFVHIPEADVIHGGDIIFYGLYPFVDVDSGGNLSGMIAGTKRMIEVAGPETRIIPGHGPLIDREQLKTYHEMLATVHQRLSERIELGQTLEEIQAAAITAEFDEQWGGGFIPPEQWVELLYRGLTTDPDTE